MQTGSATLIDMVIDAAFGSPLPLIRVDAPRLVLRDFEIGDVGCVEEASSDDLIPLITTVPANWSLVEGEAFIERQRGRRSNGEGWSLAVADVATDRALGQIGLWITHLGHGRADIGYWIAPSARGRGVAGAALSALSGWAFANLDLDRLSLFIEPWNTASIKTAEAAGFEREGLLRNWQRIAGEPKDMLSFVRTSAPLPPA